MSKKIEIRFFSNCSIKTFSRCPEPFHKISTKLRQEETKSVHTLFDFVVSFGSLTVLWNAPAASSAKLSMFSDIVNEINVVGVSAEKKIVSS